MQQTKLVSFIESIVNIGSGFFVALLLWILLVTPLWDIQVKFIDNFLITIIFTIVSVIRSYFWRRFFNHGLHNVVYNFVKRYFKNVK